VTIFDRAKKVRVWLAGRLRGAANCLHPLNKTEKERIQRLRNYAYQLQNRLDGMPEKYHMGYTRARLSALCWAVERLSGIPFDAQGGSKDVPQEERKVA
jgi:hypothetical protein